MATSATPLPSGDDAISSPQRRRRVRSPLPNDDGECDLLSPATTANAISSAAVRTPGVISYSGVIPSPPYHRRSYISHLRSEKIRSSAVLSLLPDLADLTDL
ncbi:hypothetical protein CsSME_00039325 [Camellia sinensis var. sinensis]